MGVRAGGAVFTWRMSEGGVIVVGSGESSKANRIYRN